MKAFFELLVYIVIIYFIWKFIYNKSKTKKYKYKYTDQEYFEKEVMRFENTIYAHDFKKKYNELLRRGFETAGIYIFTNLNTNRKYVGQSIHLLTRVNGHLRGHGNPELHMDMKKGQKFTIQFIKLRESGFDNLNALEKHYIYKMNSYHAGYNKTRGNS